VLVVKGFFNKSFALVASGDLGLCKGVIMWNCQFCDTEVNESSDYCPTCEYAGCTKDDHHCCDEKE
jgi:hypothetical protein